MRAIPLLMTSLQIVHFLLRTRCYRQLPRPSFHFAALARPFILLIIYRSQDVAGYQYELKCRLKTSGWLAFFLLIDDSSTLLLPLRSYAIVNCHLNFNLSFFRFHPHDDTSCCRSAEADGRNVEWIPCGVAIEDVDMYVPFKDCIVIIMQWTD